MNLQETIVAAAIVAILLAILLPGLYSVVQDTRAYIARLQVNHTARTLQFTDLSPVEVMLIRRELGIEEVTVR